MLQTHRYQASRNGNLHQNYFKKYFLKNYQNITGPFLFFQSVYDAIQKLVSTPKYSPLETEVCKDKDVYIISGVLRDDTDTPSENQFLLSEDIITASNDAAFAEMILQGRNSRVFQNLAGSLVDETDLKCRLLNDGKTGITFSSIKAFLQQYINKINVCNGFETQIIPDLPPKTCQPKAKISPRRKFLSPRLSQKVSSKRLSLNLSSSDEHLESQTQPPPTRRVLAPRYAPTTKSPAVPIKIKSTAPTKPVKPVQIQHNEETCLPLTKSKVSRPEIEESSESDAEQMKVTLQRNRDLLCDHLKDWISNNLHFDNVNEIQTVFHQWQNTIELDLPKGSQKFTEALKTLVDELQFGIGSFQSELNSIFTPSCKYFSPGELHQHMQMAFKSILQKLEHSEAFLLIEQGCNKLMANYSERNEKLIQIEKENSKEAICKIVQFHVDYFKNILSLNQVFSVSEISSLHDKINMELVTLYKSTFLDESLFIQEQQEMEAKLAASFEEFCTKYMTKLNIAQLKIKGMIEKRRNEYCNQMNALFDENAKGMAIDAFEEHHKQLFNKLAENLENEIKKEIFPEEPMKTHVAALQKYIEENYRFFSEKNKVNFENHNSKAESQALALVAPSTMADKNGVEPMNEISSSQKPNTMPGK